ncbi:MAG: hypothetical protein ACI91F_002530 [Candidatus Binatia bacterium]
MCSSAWREPTSQHPGQRDGGPTDEGKKKGAGENLPRLFQGLRKSRGPRESDRVLESLERTNPNSSRGRLGLDHDLFARERVDTLARLAGGLYDRRELR